MSLNNTQKSTWKGLTENNAGSSNNMFNPQNSGILGRTWGYTNNNDSGYMNTENNYSKNEYSNVLEAGPEDTNNDENEGNLASIPKYDNYNNKYNVLKNTPHPTDVLGSTINMLSNVATNNILNKNNKHKKHEKHKNNSYNKDDTDSETENDNNSKISPNFKDEITMLENKNLCKDPHYPYFQTSNFLTGKYCTKENIPLKESINNKEFCYLKDSGLSSSLLKKFKKEGIHECNIKNNKNKPSNNNKHYNNKVNLNDEQYMVDNNKTPININMSCNQGRAGNYSDEYGYTEYPGYGTPNTYNECNNKFKEDTLQNWYGDMSANNNVYRRRQRWRDRDYYREGYGRPNYSLSHKPSKNTDIGLPYSTYLPYSPIN